MASLKRLTILKEVFLILLFFPLHIVAQRFTESEVSQWQQQSKQVNIIRDKWGIPHVYGKTDADAVFGLLYAQCEDDFPRVEMNYIEKLGRLSEVKGESELYNDLLIRLLIDSTDAINDYNKAEPWLKKLLNAYADGINYYLYKNPAVKPVLLQRFKPWYPLLWTDGSIGAINTAGVTTTELKSFYGGDNTSAMNTAALPVPEDDEHLNGSNGFAIAPSKSESGNSLLYINPHVTFYFRPEVHMVSEEGLNSYGAITWGQFFIYQGFNEHCGWMHTSSEVDVADLYEEKIIKKDGSLFYEYDKKLKPVIQKKITLQYRDGQDLKTKTITGLYTHHGPVMASRNGKWISLKSYNRSMTSLIQCWQRLKTTGFASFKKVMDLKANASNNTVYADAEGNIAYWHGNFIPVRDKKLDWSKPVDGTTNATEWMGLHKVEETIHIYDPINGWLQNCNSTPFTAAGVNSPRQENYPAYMAPDAENFRAINAVRLLSSHDHYTIDKLITIGYDRTLTAFEILIPALVSTFENNGSRYDIKDAIAILKAWDYKTSDTSVATTLAIEWAERIRREIQMTPTASNNQFVEKTKAFTVTASADNLLRPLASVLKILESKFGTWRIPWGSINRYQRLTGAIDEKYDDSLPSLPVGFAASTWGMLPSFTSKYSSLTNKRYGYGGNSFICAVEFGKKIKAKSLLAGGESGHPASQHFDDQSIMYTKGQFKDVLFYKEDVLKNIERSYHPGE
jgi:acyl-homoserine-lactone acylase